MDCPSDCGLQRLEGDDFLSALGQRVRAQRVPFSGSVEVTSRCNLRCVHCYVEDRNSSPRGPGVSQDPSADELCGWIGQAAEAGCLYLVLTGGEPLLHPHFAEIYRRAKAWGLFVTVFSNGTAIGERHMDVFGESHPRRVEISLYGASPETYGQVTGHPEAFDRCMAGIDTLLAAGIRVSLKTVLMKGNAHDLPRMEALARDRGVSFRFDMTVSGRVGRDLSPVELRVPAEDAVRMEMSQSERRREWLEFSGRQANLELPPDCLYACGGGRTSFHIDAHGMLQPCPSNAHIGIDLHTQPFASAWAQLGCRVAEPAAAPLPCNACHLRAYCSWCPAFAFLDGRSDWGPVQYLCDVARARRDALRDPDRA